VASAFADLNVFRALLHQPEVAQRVGDLLITLIFKVSLSHRLRELLIMRIGWATGCDYEWTQHWRIALDQFGLTEAELIAVRDWRAADCFDATDRAVLAATDETLMSGRVSPQTFTELEEVLPGPAELVDVLTSIGCWRLISQFARSTELKLEEGVASWPPDGTSPQGAS
jgi:alkylhydroperoxidase family enzyme